MVEMWLSAMLVLDCELDGMVVESDIEVLADSFTEERPCSKFTVHSCKLIAELFD